MPSPILAPPPSLAEGAALFLDFDGTLVELAETPQAIRVSPALDSLLSRLSHRLHGRLAIVSGRAIADLERHLDCSAVAVSGSHGLELRLRDGTELPLAAPAGLAEARREVDRFAASVAGLLAEHKPYGVALHFRRAPERAESARSFMEALAANAGLVVQTGKMVVELRPGGADKGDAVRAFMAEPEFAGARPVFVGDDVTDESAFEAAAGLGGAGILVGPPRATAALWRLDGVAAVAAWLGEEAR
ncbi:trehalose-phosphatase [Enterovirga sp. GCM10030262]|uniref:trehalose-phosphatase n=1 Tax=Enterovirga sp. GCM10030262 TaxID=3273391 RepID=UPI00360BA66C